MASKLDQSLDEIAGGRRAGPRRRVTRKPAPAVAGGVSKKTAPRPVKPNNKPASASTPALPTRGDSKIIVSNLPEDVNEQQIKEYFASTVGPVRRVILNYNKAARSTGVANIIFTQPTLAAEAAKSYNGVKVDGKPMKIEVVMGAQYVPEPPAPKTLKDRIAVPKSATAKPKPATNGKARGPNTGGKGAVSAAAGGAQKGRGRKAAPRSKKTAEELDADMADYFDSTAGGAAPAANGAAAAASAAPNGGEASMEDEIM